MAYPAPSSYDPFNPLGLTSSSIASPENTIQQILVQLQQLEQLKGNLIALGVIPVEVLHSIGAINTPTQPPVIPPQSSALLSHQGSFVGNSLQQGLDSFLSSSATNHHRHPHLHQFGGSNNNNNPLSTLNNLQVLSALTSQALPPPPLSNEQQQIQQLQQQQQMLLLQQAALTPLPPSASHSSYPPRLPEVTLKRKPSSSSDVMKQRSTLEAHSKTSKKDHKKKKHHEPGSSRSSSYLSPFSDMKLDVGAPSFSSRDGSKSAISSSSSSSNSSDPSKLVSSSSLPQSEESPPESDHPKMSKSSSSSSSFSKLQFKNKKAKLCSISKSPTDSSSSPPDQTNSYMSMRKPPSNASGSGTSDELKGDVFEPYPIPTYINTSGLSFQQDGSFDSFLDNYNTSEQHARLPPSQRPSSASSRGLNIFADAELEPYCEPDCLSFDPSLLLLDDLKEELRLRSLPNDGPKPALIERLTQAVASDPSLPRVQMTPKRRAGARSKEPQRSEYTSEEAFQAAWSHWREFRDSNNESARKSRNHAKEKRKEHDMKTHELAEENAALEEYLAQLRKDVNIVAQALQRSSSLSKEEKLAIKEIMDARFSS